MKRVVIAGAAFLVLIGLSLIALRTIPQHIYHGFESTDLNSFRWSERRLVPGAVKSDDAFVRSGNRAPAITVWNGDRYEPAVSGGAATERNELMESWWLYSRSGRSYVYSFSLNLPLTFLKRQSALCFLSGDNYARRNIANLIDRSSQFVMKTGVCK
jgi:hypothetical protein